MTSEEMQHLRSLSRNNRIIAYCLSAFDFSGITLVQALYCMVIEMDQENRSLESAVKKLVERSIDPPLVMVRRDEPAPTTPHTRLWWFWFLFKELFSRELK